MPYSSQNNFRGNEAYLRLASIENERVRGGTKTPPSVRKAYTVECNLEGSGAVFINGRRFDIKVGDCYILMPGDVIEYYSSKEDPRRGIWCGISGNRVGEALSAAGISSDTPIAPPECFDGAKEIMEKMIMLNGKMDIGSEYKRTALVYELLGVLTEGKTETKSELWLARALDILETRYYSKLSVSELAASVGFERSYFSTLFKERVGISPHEYLNKIRISEASRLLERGMSVAEAAECVGLEVKNFARLFRAIRGITPKDVKNKNQK